MIHNNKFKEWWIPANYRLINAFKSFMFIIFTDSEYNYNCVSRFHWTTLSLTIVVVRLMSTVHDLSNFKCKLELSTVSTQLYTVHAISMTLWFGISHPMIKICCRKRNSTLNHHALSFPYEWWIMDIYYLFRTAVFIKVLIRFFLHQKNCL